MKYYSYIARNLLGIFFFIAYSAYGQVDAHDEPISLNLSTLYHEAIGDIIFLLPITELPKSISNKINFPDLQEMSDTLFAKVLFRINNFSAIKDSILILVTNHQHDTPLLWVDYNNNLDFCDDAGPITFSNNTIDIKVRDIHSPETHSILQIVNLDSGFKETVQESLNDYLVKYNYLEYLNYSDYYVERRFNIVAGDFIIEQDSFRIGIMDANINGLYNDIGSDLILTGRHSGRFYGYSEQTGAIPIDSVTYFLVESTVYRLIEVAADGSLIVIQSVESDMAVEYFLGSRIVPDLSYISLNNDTLNLQQLKNQGKYIYLYLWHESRVTGTHSQYNDELFYLNNLEDMVALIGLHRYRINDRDNLLLEKYAIPWIIGTATSETHAFLRHIKIGRGVLIDPSGNIILINVNPLQVVELFR